MKQILKGESTLQRFRDQGTWQPMESDYEQIKDPVSMTLPDDAYSIGEILERFGAGIQADYKEGYYSDTDDYDDIDIFSQPDFDLSDRERIVDQVESLLGRKSDDEATNEAKQNEELIEDQDDTLDSKERVNPKKI